MRLFNQDQLVLELQMFLVESIDDWRVEADGTVKVLIEWQEYDESERTWEPLDQVCEDVPVITNKYVTEVNDDTLTEALDQVEESSSSDDDTSDEEESSEWDRQRILLVVFIGD
mgnify:CR=1 FL=1